MQNVEGENKKKKLKNFYPVNLIARTYKESTFYVWQ